MSKFLDVARQHREKKQDLERLLEHLLDELRQCLGELGLHATIDGRIKSASSSWLKARLKGRDLTELDDLVGLRVLVERTEDCYRVMSAATSRWTQAAPMQDRIVAPKANGYQSLQAILSSDCGRLFELQVRTHAMQKACEIGPAEHKRYKARQLAGGGGEPLPPPPVWLEGTSRGSSAIDLAMALGLVVVVGFFDYVSGWSVGFAIFYLLPIAISTWRVGGIAGLVLSAVSTMVWWWVDNATSPLQIHPAVTAWNALMRLGIFALLSVTLQQLRSALRKNEELARTDQLTGLPNARAFFEKASRHLERKQDAHDALTLAFIDLDDFKGINLRLGHSGADRLLRGWGRELREAVRSVDLVARLGGDEFAILFPHTRSDEARAIVRRLHERLTERASQLEPPVGFSLGAVTFGTPPTSVDELLHEADLLMFEAKALDSGQRIRHDLRDPSG